LFFQAQEGGEKSGKNFRSQMQHRPIVHLNILCFTCPGVPAHHSILFYANIKTSRNKINLHEKSREAGHGGS
jgi:hypothetical protein